MGVFSLSCWKPQATPGLNSGGNLFSLLPFTTRSSERGGTEGDHLPLPGRLRSAHPSFYRPTFLLVISLPEEDPQEKTLCQTPAWDKAGCLTGISHSCELSPHRPLAPPALLSSQICPPNIQIVAETVQVPEIQL
uniref:Uncharacterized protein n=1 Tax=Rousettus aegyptiacus TaxID=9407 RepID=A0A7J8DHN9_ROUAE|nr:hypothetical protein HJG63_008565 [Rousettus aegyptiacus]